METESLGEDELVSVIIPFFNRIQLLPRALSSVLGQTHPDLEVILVDDGSQEDSGPVLDRFRDPRVRVLRHEFNRGVSAARNTGLKAAQGRFVCFLDSDDEWLTGKVSRQLVDLRGKGAGQVSYCFSELILDGADGESPVHAGVKDFQEEGDILRFALRSSVRTKVGNALCVLMNEIMISREDLLRAGGFNERYRLHEDWDMLIRLASRYRFSCVKEVLVRNHKHALGHADGDYARIPEVRQGMMQEHRELFSDDRSARAAFYSELAYYQALCGRRGEAFLSLLRCAACRPWDRDPYVKLLMLLMNRIRACEDVPAHG